MNIANLMAVVVVAIVAVVGGMFGVVVGNAKATILNQTMAASKVLATDGVVHLDNGIIGEI